MLDATPIITDGDIKFQIKATTRKFLHVVLHGRATPKLTVDEAEKLLRELRRLVYWLDPSEERFIQSMTDGDRD